MGHDRVHAFLHTYVGASLAIVAVVVLHRLLWAVAGRWVLPNLFGWRELSRSQVVVGAMLGAYSHVLLDSVMHADMTPLWPFSDRNALHAALSWDALHYLCVALGVAGVVILVVRYLIARRSAA